MDEISSIHTQNLEWGCIANMIDRLSAVEEGMDGHWDELLDMIADIIGDESNEKDVTKIFFSVYQFVFRLYYRIRNNPTKRAFNQITKIIIGEKEVYRITNYDYKTFKWATAIGCDGISNDCIDIPKDILTFNQCRALDRRIKEEKTL